MWSDRGDGRLGPGCCFRAAANEAYPDGPLTSSRDVDRITFTGSSATGVKILEATAKNHTPVSAEMGDKSATIVFDDADLDIAVPMAIRAIFGGNGQVCLSCSRLLVQDGPDQRRPGSPRGDLRASETVLGFRTEEEALRIANDSPYGLAGMLFTTSRDRSHRMARCWKAGTVWINTFFERDLPLPFGGEQPYQQALGYAWALIRMSWAHPDFKEGPRAFAEKCTPNWTV